MPKPSIFVIHENDEWLPPLRQAFEALGTPYEEWFLDELALDLGAVPAQRQTDRPAHLLSLMLRSDALEHGAHIDRAALADELEVLVKPASHGGAPKVAQLGEELPFDVHF